MVRPKTILWVDDEVDGLAAHRRFLEDQGFTVAAAAHGDDALALLRRQPYSIVLLDEQMPGRRGLELIVEIRALDPAMPVVMVTQSEDEGTLREAIGIEVDDYLVKPVQPRQILSVITRLLEGDRIRQQRLARDFVTRFRELEGRRGASLAWREWIELVAELARWEVRLAASNEPGLSEALRSLQRSLRKDFAEYVARQYPRWLAGPEGDRPPLSVDVGAEFLVPVLVFNFVDQLTHGRSESAILYEVARDEAALRSLTRTWFERSPVLAALREAERRGVTVLLTTDHGSIHCETPATVYAKRDATANLRYKFGEDLRSEDPEAALSVEDLKSYGLPGMGLGVRLLLAAGDRFFVYPTKLREYQARYRGSFLHGGVTPEEMILPVALLTPRGRAKGSGSGGTR